MSGAPVRLQTKRRMLLTPTRLALALNYQRRSLLAPADLIGPSVSIVRSVIIRLIVGFVGISHHRPRCAGYAAEMSL